MIGVADSSVLMYLFDPHCRAPRDSEGIEISNCGARVEALIARLSKSNGQLIIPTPVLSELLVHAGDAGPIWLGAIEGKRAIRVASFDQMAAVECAALASERASRSRTAPRAKAKFDEQIVAIARVVGATEIYSDDDDIRKLAGPDIAVIGIADLPLPPSAAQADLPFDDPEHPDK